jgi:uncharacterized protein (DUF302 family)
MPKSFALLSSMAVLAVTASLAHAQQPAGPKAAVPAKPTPPRVEAGLVAKASKLPVKETIDAIAKAAEEKGARIVARVDHAGGAKQVGADMKASQLLVFGNPKLGTPLMLTNPRVGLDLPLKVLAYEDAAGRSWVVYTAPAALAAKYKLKSKAEGEAVKAAAGALEAIIGAAAISP